MIDLRIEGLGGRVMGHAQDVATTDASQAAGPGDEQEAQGAHAADQVLMMTYRILAHFSPKV